jgi:hypothetical protein
MVSEMVSSALRGGCGRYRPADRPTLNCARPGRQSGRTTRSLRLTTTSPFSLKNAPEFDEDRYRDEGYRSELGGYYGQGGAGYRDDLR